MRRTKYMKVDIIRPNKKNVYTKASSNSFKFEEASYDIFFKNQHDPDQDRHVYSCLMN